jgi:Uncharacterized protein conserved in bacteria
MTHAADLVRDRRQRFALPGGSHDRLVSLLAKGLPAGIGAIVAVMVVAPLFPRGEISFLLDRNKVAVTEERLRVDNAMYRGEDAQGRPFSVTAGNAAQKDASMAVVQMNDLTARILLKDGPAELHARDGDYDFGRNLMNIRGPVDFRAADGYRFTTTNVAIDLRNKTAVGSGGVAGAVPTGTFRADRIEADLEARTVALQGRARLTMQGGPR